MTAEEELSSVLEEQLKLHPVFEALDALKLIKQCASGSSHFTGNRDSFLKNLKAEMSSLNPEREESDGEYIGFGLYRLNLAPAVKRGVSPEKIADAFFSAKGGCDFGTLYDCLLKKARTGLYPFTENEILSFPKDAVYSHSEAYKKAYSPSYRLIPASLNSDFIK